MAKRASNSKRSAKSNRSNSTEKQFSAAATPSEVNETDRLPDFVKQHLQQLAQSEENKLTLQPLPDHFRMLGRLPLLPPLGTHSGMVPDEFTSHPLIKGESFYTLPPGLLQSIERHATQVTRENNLWPLEKSLAAVCNDHSHQVGFKQTQPLHFSLLRPSKPFGLTAELARNLGWNELNVAQIGQVNRTLDERSTWINTIARGYAGWLNTNAEFRRERDEVFASGPRVVSLMPDANSESSGDSLPKVAQEFLVRWRLLGMAGIRLPIPMRPMLSGDFPTSILRQLIAAGGVFNLPDIYPIPSRDALRSMLEEAVRDSKPEYLSEWMKITQSNNLTKAPIARFARLLEVQHYWELLFERHEAHVKGEITRLREAIADFLGTTDDSIKKDLQFLRNKLSRSWPKLGSN
ncbi:hypothetical protein [Anatilimnocola floriformis]|uniref:hypothetical protein n=1 Tax=Anatilimnocola floriformis TaxID=2948575 RepID=UPI0020C45885|nr:hypothetical protein [Anatilimnocola floriformis]